MLQARGGPALAISAVVDSGAFSCCLPSGDTSDLEIPQQKLTRAGEIVLADDSTVPYLESTLTVRAQVLAQQTPVTEPRPWGPIFELRPAFIEGGSRLLGQRDFFHRFEITFSRGRTPPTFTLRYDPH